MNVDAFRLNRFLNNSVHFHVPNYQRPYSWKGSESQKLLEDILRVGEMENTSYARHFIGSIVIIRGQSFGLGTSQTYQLIDGQQRLTSLMLMIIALEYELDPEYQANLGNSEIVSISQFRNLLINQSDRDYKYYKLYPSILDRELFTRLIDRKNYSDLEDSDLKFNFESYLDQIKLLKEENKILHLIRGLTRVEMVVIDLDPQQDNPQAIFESLNSTGMALSQADLLRNYIFMSADPRKVDMIHKEYWSPMEQLFDRKNFKKDFNSFVQHYLEAETSKSSKGDNLYEDFKDFILPRISKGTYTMEMIIKELHEFAKVYTSIIYDCYPDKDLSDEIKDVMDTGYTVMLPLLSKIVLDYQEELLSKNQLIQALDILESYLVRRMVCNLRANSLQRIVFDLLAHGIERDRENYLSSFKLYFMNLKKHHRFPGNDEFQRAFQSNSIYDLKSSKLILRQLMHSYNKKEKVNSDILTIEHIMPQKLTDDWKRILGPEADKIHDQYLHSIGNLTLTGYNSEMKNGPFDMKKQEYSKSNLYFNQIISREPTWSKDTIERRSKELAQVALTIWPAVHEQGIDMTKKLKTKKKEIGEHAFFTNSKPMVEKLYNEFKVIVKGFDDRMTLSVQKNRLSYGIKRKPVAKVRPLKTKLRIWLTNPENVVNLEDEEEISDEELEEEAQTSRSVNFIEIESKPELYSYKQNFLNSYHEVLRQLGESRGLGNE